MKRIIGNVIRSGQAVCRNRSISSAIVEENSRFTFLGTHYGGWATPIDIGPEPVVYSIGVGTDISWDEAVIERFGCDIHAFDPTPRCLAWVNSQQLPSSFHFHACGVADYDGKATFHFPKESSHVSCSMVEVHGSENDPVACEVRTVRSLMRELGHSRVDVLKLDIEGAEYGVIRDLIENGPLPKYLLVEFHHRFRGIGYRRTRETLKQLSRVGYAVFATNQQLTDFSLVRKVDGDGGH